jgi:glycosyltransferase involved in cell wall biosynthesis
LSKSIIFTLRNSRLPTVYHVADGWLMTGVREDPWLRWWNRPGGPFASRVWRWLLELARQRSRADAHAPTRLTRGYDRLPDVYGDAASLAKVPPNSISAFRFDRVYLCSQALKEETERAGFRVHHGEVIYPGIPTQHFVGDVKPASAPVEKFLLVSRLHRKSGAMTAVKALQTVRAKRPGTRLSLYGRGDSDYIAELRSYIAMNQLPVDFLNVSNVQRDLPGIYRKHDALLYTAEWSEPFSLTPLEAMSCGLPVIGAAIGGARELFRHGENALTYTPGDAEELAARIEELQAQSELRCQLAETAQMEAASKYNETAVTDQIESFLDTSCQAWQHAAS